MNPFSSRRNKLIALLIIIITGLSGKLFSQTYSTAVNEKIKQVENGLTGGIIFEGDKPVNLLDRMKQLDIPGVSMAVISNYKIEWAKGYGVADKTRNQPVTPQSLFQAASISKSLNGVGAMNLVQQKKLSLNEDINNYLVSWKFPYDSASGGKKITLANLLSHTAGTTVHGFPGYEITDQLPSVNEVLNGAPPANTKAVRSQFAPGTRVQYSGGGTTITQVIISDLSGRPYHQYMNEQVLKPMGMTMSFYDQPAPAAKTNLLTTGHKDDGSPVKGLYHIYPEQAAAGLWTNPTDLARYVIETQLSWQGKSAKLLTQESTKIRLTPVMENAALGVFILKRGGATYFQHGGANEGFRCQYFGDLENGNGVVVMINSDNGAILNEIIHSVATVYGWKEFYKPDVRKKIIVPENKLKSYLGVYELSPNFKITITLDGKTLFGQATNQPAFPLFPETENLFFTTVVDAKIEFLPGKLILHQNGQKMEGKKE